MSNSNHLEILSNGVKYWNNWRSENPNERPDLVGAKLQDMQLNEINFCDVNLNNASFNNTKLYRANLRRASLMDTAFENAILEDADLIMAKIRRANLSFAKCFQTSFEFADLSNANLFGTGLRRAKLYGANLCNADLSEANLRESNLTEANLTKARLNETNLKRANLDRAIFKEAVLEGADLSKAVLLETNFKEANLANSRVYGISAWDLVLDNTKQVGLIITKKGDPVITVNDIEVAQFIHIMLENKKIRRVIDTMTSKAVLILGRFTEKRKAILEALREKLSTMDYLPIIFDFNKPTDRDLTETVKTLAGLSKFIIMDLSDPNSSPHEAVVTITNFKVPFLPILEVGQEEYAMFDDLRQVRPWVLQGVKYNDQNHLVNNIEKLTKLAEEKYTEIQVEKNQKRSGAAHLDDL